MSGEIRLVFRMSTSLETLFGKVERGKCARPPSANANATATAVAVAKWKGVPGYLSTEYLPMLTGLYGVRMHAWTLHRRIAATELETGVIS